MIVDSKLCEQVGISNKQCCGSGSGIRIRKDPGFSNTKDPDPGFYPDPDPYIKKRTISQLVPSIFYEINFFENCK